MKNFFLAVFTLLFTATLAACEGDEAVPAPPTPPLYAVGGAWHGVATLPGATPVPVTFTISVDGAEVTLEYKSAGEAVLYTGTLKGAVLSASAGESRLDGTFGSAESFSGAVFRASGGGLAKEADLELESGEAPAPVPAPAPLPSFDLALSQSTVDVNLDDATSVLAELENAQNVSGEPTLSVSAVSPDAAATPSVTWEVVSGEGDAFEIFFEAPSSTVAPGTYAFDVTVSFGDAEEAPRRTARLAVNVNSPPQVSPLSWARGAASPASLYEAQGATVGDLLYVFGGFYNQKIEASARVFAYNPLDNTWTRLSDMPERLTHAGTAVDGEEVFVAGGFLGDHPGESVDSVWIYNTSDDTWTKGPSLPAKRGGGALVKLGRTLHFFGGTLRLRGRYLEDSSDHWTLDLDDPTAWDTAPPLPNPRNHTAGVALGGKVYAIGGQHLGDEENGNQRSVHVFDPATQTWAEAAPLPTPLSHTSASTLVWEGRIVVVGGVTQKSREVRTVYAYDPVENAWETWTPLPAPRQSPVAGFAKGNLVVTTGSANTTHPKSDTWLSQ